MYARQVFNQGEKLRRFNKETKPQCYSRLLNKYNEIMFIEYYTGGEIYTGICICYYSK